MLLALTLLIGITENAFAERGGAPSIPMEESPALQAAKAEVQAYPKDYGAWVRLARAAEPFDAALAVEAWVQAEALSGGNLESSAGQVMPRLVMGDVAGAQAASLRALEYGPEDPGVWSLRAEALRHPSGLGGSSRAAWRAHAAARTAMALAPEDPLALCAIGWSHVRLGDRASAHAAFTQAGDAPCAEAGLAASSLDPRLRERVWGTVLIYPDALGGGAGAGLTGHVGLRLQDRYDLAATPRLTYISQSGLQAELWLSGALVRGGSGVRAVLAGVKAPANTELPPPLPGLPPPPSRANGAVLGLQAWGTRWATLKLDASALLFGDGTGWQSGLRVSVPLSDPLSLELGGALSAFSEALSPEGIVPEDWAGEGPAPSGEATLRWSQGDWGATLHGRLGTRYRPTSLDLDNTWNLSAATTATLGAAASWTHASGRRFSLGYDALSLHDADTDESSWLHVLSFGVNIDTELAP
ncbi:MAG: hypothetical protein H6741_10465 [Alphaproteobacteria bacterium]|nr:hypothetical protein [Alphaproteobacteria bacterium]